MHGSIIKDRTWKRYIKSNIKNTHLGFVQKVFTTLVHFLQVSLVVFYVVNKVLQGREKKYNLAVLRVLNLFSLGQANGNH